VARRRARDPNERRGELVTVAGLLFAERGYEATTIEDIIGRAGLSKGAFYHYFRSKEDLLEALAEQAAQRALAMLDDAGALSGFTALEGLNHFLARGRAGAGAPDIATFGAIFRPENLALYHRLHRAVAAVLAEPLARLIEQGIKEGVMFSGDPRTTAEIVLGLGSITHDAVAGILAARTADEFEAGKSALRHRLEQQGIAVDRILGLPDGSVRFWDQAFSDQWRFVP
jgi:AcrR family transcriptional regulator